tara:strand:- start:9349 stop:10053 length:705 start_codon:yes stop_codon:yes gene_type:complete
MSLPKFVTNSIHVGKGISFNDYVEKLTQPKQEVKTAQANDHPKQAAEDDEADSSGQLDVEPLHQEGESTPKPHKEKEAAGVENFGDKKAEPFGKKDEKDDKDDKDEDDKEASADAEVKLAACECGCTDTDDDGNCKECGKACKPCEAEAEGETKEAESKEDEEGPDSGQPKAEENLVQGPGTDRIDEEADDQKKLSSGRFKKIANLTDEEKTRLRTYWGNLYPDAYVDAMLQNK